MAHDPDERVKAVARLETAIASVRRAPRRVVPSRPGCLRLTPCARVVRVAGRAPDVLSTIRRRELAPALVACEEPVLVLRTPDGDDVTVEGLLPDLAIVLERAAAPIRRDDLEALIRSRGSSTADAVEIVDGLVADAVLL
jgi:hypothetical protein